MQPHLRTRVQSRRGVDTFTWDHENRLTQSSVGGVTSSSVYYGNGVRRSHTVNGVSTTYTYDVGAGLPVVLQDGTNTLVYGLDLISTTDAGGTQRYFSYDGLGSVTDLTDGTGAVTDTYSYDIFGAVRARTGTNASPWKFTGEQEDGTTGDTGYTYLRARYMDPATGRFISKDPIEYDQRYAYVANNPVRAVDPRGLAAEAAPLDYDDEWGKDGPPIRGPRGWGGRGPVDRGRAGVDAVDRLLSQVGFRTVREVTFETPSGLRVRADLVARMGDRLVIVEVKNGPTARLSTNQQQGYYELSTKGGYPLGPNAERIGYPRGDFVGPQNVQVYHLSYSSSSEGEW